MEDQQAHEAAIPALTRATTTFQQMQMTINESPRINSELLRQRPLDPPRERGIDHPGVGRRCRHWHGP